MKYFGTDGIRGEIDNGLDSLLAYKVGYAVGRSIIDNEYSKKVLIGNDTRISNDVITHSIACGIMDTGVDCLMLGIVPTACVSFLTQTLDVGYGIMVTASHNSWEMNGIKIMNRFGFKCDENEEQEIENYIDSDRVIKTVYKGKTYGAEKYVNNYTGHILRSISVDLRSKKIVLDLANGSNYKIGPTIFKSLGANVINLSTSNNGLKINENCGAQHIEHLQQAVIKNKCDFGFAFDGDADRLRIVLSDGTILDGDDILFVFAMHLYKANKLNKNTIVGTIMTNLGVEETLKDKGINLIRVDVGDKNVIKALKTNDYCIGGETSGHIALIEYNRTCDALFNALFFLKIIIEDNINIIELLKFLKKYPKYESNIKVSKAIRQKFCDKNFVEKLNQEIKLLEDDSRIICRPSGTEAVIRISVESNSEEVAKQKCKKIEEIIKALEN